MQGDKAMGARRAALGREWAGLAGGATRYQKK